MQSGNILWSIISFYNFLLIRIVIVLVMMLMTAAYLVYFERKISAWAQNRLGPNRVGWQGYFNLLRMFLNFYLKKILYRMNANKKIHTLAPMIALICCVYYLCCNSNWTRYYYCWLQIPMVVADVNIGILYVLALTSLGVYAITFAGWSSGSKYSLLGGIRSSAQMISYEISMGFSIGGVILLAESLRPMAIVESQSGWMWNAIIQPIGFITFVVSAFAETNRLPFDLPEAEPELVGGYHTEYSSMKFAAFFLAEYANMLIASTLNRYTYISADGKFLILKL